MCMYKSSVKSKSSFRKQPCHPRFKSQLELFEAISKSVKRFYKEHCCDLLWYNQSQHNISRLGKGLRRQSREATDRPQGQPARDSPRLHGRCAEASQRVGVGCQLTGGEQHMLRVPLPSQLCCDPKTVLADTVTVT